MLWLQLLSVALAAVLGIDFGAEFTKACLVAPSIPFEIILNPGSQRKDASGIVFRERDGVVERFYGSGGLPLTSRFPQSSFYYLKSLLGRTVADSEVAEFNKYHPGLTLTQNSRHGLSVSVGDTSYPVEQIIAMSLKEVKDRAQAELPPRTGSVSKVVVTVPGDYDMAQRRALSDAVQLADLQLIALVNDGVAVAVNYASTRQFGPKQYIAIYDVGSESTSSTLVSIEDLNGTTAISLEGFASLPVGGKSLTAIVRDLIVTQFRKQTGIQDELGARVLNRLWKEAERAKAVLSANTETSVFIESLYKDHDVNVKLTRKDLEASAAVIVEEVVTPLQNSLETFNGEVVETSQLESIILAGGGTRVPFIQQRIREYAGDILSKNVNADESAVLGATLRGVGISGVFKSKPIVVNDKAIHSFAVNDGTATQPLFERGSALDSSTTLSVPADDRTVTLFENDAKIVSWTFPQLAEGLKLLESDERKCVSDPELVLKFQLSNSEIVNLVEASVKCKTETDEIPKSITRYLNAKRTDFGVQPLSTADREELAYGLRVLDKQDSDRLKKQTMHNSLESLLYQIRELEPEHERAHQLLEQLEDHLTVVALSERLKEAQGIYDKLVGASLKQQFEQDVRIAFAEVGVVAESLDELLANANLQQLEHVVLKQKGPLYDEIRAQISSAIDLLTRDEEEVEEAEEKDEL